MILITKVSCKNFLSYGNAMTSFDLSSHKATLIRGKNGHGKSVILDLLLYGLYGRPYRQINKPQLVNSINRGDMLVEIEFKVGATEYIVRRGIKPNIFDIFKDGELIEQTAAIKDYQSFLETQILKIPERTFKQIAVLGSASYVPFMKLQAWQRRELVESILEIEVFSVMNVILKERINSTREEFNLNTTKIEAKKNEAIAQQKLIKVIEQNFSQRVEDHNNQIDILKEDLQALTAKIYTAETSLESAVGIVYDSKLLDANTRKINSVNQEIKTAQKKVKEFDHIEKCPTCLQEVSAEHIDLVHKEFNSLLSTLNNSLEKLQVNRIPLVEEEQAWHQQLFDRTEIKNQISQWKEDSRKLQESIDSISTKIQGILSDTSNLEIEKERLKDIAKSALCLVERKNHLSEEKHLQDVAQQLLKDTGIKTAVVKEYLPILNQLINKYLSMFDFFVDFTLDESFEEVIKSRGRDVFSYSSFSEGEKRRIDFAILMAFRQLAAMKNSAKTNILVLDEIVDGAFDLEARAAFNDLLINIPNSNIIVISHADASTEQYDRVIQVEKQGDFSSYSVVE